MSVYHSHYCEAQFLIIGPILGKYSGLTADIAVSITQLA